MVRYFAPRFESAFALCCIPPFDASECVAHRSSPREQLLLLRGMVHSERPDPVTRQHCLYLDLNVSQGDVA
jgi:hypothetical protein